MRITESNYAQLEKTSICDWVRREGRKLLITDRVSNVNRMLRQYERKYGMAIKEVYGKTLDDIAAELIVAYHATIKNVICPVKRADVNIKKSVMYRVLMLGKWSSIPAESIDMTCAGEVLDSINQLRGNDVSEEYIISQDKKIEDIKGIIKEYEKIMSAEGLYDEIMLEREALNIIDSMQSQAIEQGMSCGLENAESWKIQDLLPWLRECKIGIFENTELNGIQIKLLDKFREIAADEKKDMSILKVNVSDTNLADAETAHGGNGVKVELFKAYGFENEVRYITKVIAKKKIATGDVNIFYTDHIYEKLLRAELEARGIGYIFVNGISGMYSDAICALISVLDFAVDDLSYESLGKVIENPLIHRKGVKLYREFRRTSSEGIGWGIGRYRDYIERKKAEFAKEDAEETENNAENNTENNAENSPENNTENSPENNTENSSENNTENSSENSPENNSENSSEKDLEERTSIRGFVQFLEDLCDIFYDDKSLRDVPGIYAHLVEFARNSIAGKKKFNMEILPVLNEGYEFIDQISKNGASESYDITEAVQCIKNYLENVTYKESGAMAERISAKQQDESDADVASSNTEEDEDKIAAAAVHIYRLTQYTMPDREHNFFIGLTSSQFTGKESDSPVLGDDELKKYVAGKPDLAVDAVKKNKSAFVDTIDSLIEGTIYLGRSVYDTVNFLQLAAASVLLDYEPDLEGESDPETEKIENRTYSYDLVTDWDTEEVSDEPEEVSDEIEEVSDEPEEVSDEIAESESEEGKTDDKITKMSSTALKSLVNCPLQYYYHYVKFIKNPDYYKKDAFGWLPANMKGNLFHETLDGYCKAIDDAKWDEKPNEDIFNRTYEDVVKNISNKVPSYSEEQREKEIAIYRDLIWKYIKHLHDYMKREKEAKRNWKIIESELEFKDLIYEGHEKTETDTSGVDNNLEKQEKPENGFELKGMPFKISFYGAIDRLEGYVDNDILYLHIIDYKTGLKSNLDKALKKGIQLQHYIYSAAAIDHFERNREELSKEFGVKELKDCVIYSVDYVFPYEDNDKDDVAIINVTDTVNKSIKCVKVMGDGDTADEGQDQGKGVKRCLLPDHVYRALLATEGTRQNLSEDESVEIMQKYLLNNILTEGRDVGYFDDNKYGGRALSDSEICSFCEYIDICRMRCYGAGPENNRGKGAEN